MTDNSKKNNTLSQNGFSHIESACTKEIGVQTEEAERDYISLKQLSLMQTESSAFPQFLYHQHTIF